MRPVTIPISAFRVRACDLISLRCRQIYGDFDLFRRVGQSLATFHSMELPHLRDFIGVAEESRALESHVS